MRERLKNLTIGQKLVVIQGTIVVVVLAFCGILAKNYTSNYMEKIMETELSSKTQLVIGMMDTYNSALTQSSERLNRTFSSYFPKNASLNTSQTVMINGTPTPALKLGGKAVNLDFSEVDRFTGITGAVATIFAKSGEDFVRVTTSLKKEDGSRAIGTFLGNKHPGFKNLMSGKPYTGKATLFGRDYITKYTPIFDDSGNTIGIFFIGLDFTEGLKSLKDKIRSIKVGETGYIYALDGKEGPTYGTLVVHPAKEGTNILDSKDADGREFIKEILQKKNGIIRYPWLNKELRETKAREKIVVYAPYDNWNWVIGTGMYVEDFTRITDSILKYMLWGGLILTTLLVLLVYWCSRYFVYHPLKKAVDFATAVAEGDLTQSIESEWNDEAGRLAQALDKMAHRLRELISVVKTSADDVAFGSQQLNQKSENISSGALIQASAADQTSSSMEEMSASFKSVSESAECLAENVQETSSTIMEMTRSFDKVSSDAEMLSSSVSDTSRTIKQMTASIDHIAKNADMLTGTVAETSSTIKEMAASISQVDGNTSDASQLSHKAALDAKAGSDAVERAIEGISRIAEVMDENYKVIGTLSKRSVDIGMIVEVIEDIADQTKLLALNATIEAAKAGAEGRGFAVVAQEVKNLANRSVSATSEIGKLIKQVQIETANAVKTTEAASHETKEGIKLADKAGESLKRILESVGATNEIMSAIANATQEQSLAATQMLKLVEDMVHSTDQVTNAVKEQSSGTDHIRTAIENINLITIQVAHAMKEQTVAGNRILQAVETMNSMTQQVANATTEQKYTGEVVVKAIEQITDIARDNLKAVQELSRASQDMTSRAVAMHQAINAFKTGSEMTMS